MTSVPSLTPGRTPVLVDKEHVIAHYPVVLKTDHTKLSGVLYLTQLRVVYVDFKRPLTRSVQTKLINIRGFDLPKSTDLVIKSELARDAENSWVCQICSYINEGDALVCATCGVKKDLECYESNVDGVKNSSDLEFVRGECPQCTFLNNPLLKYCEMCGVLLRTAEMDSKPCKMHIRFQKSSICSDIYRQIQQLQQSLLSSKSSSSSNLECQDSLVNSTNMNRSKSVSRNVSESALDQTEGTGEGTGNGSGINSVDKRALEFGIRRLRVDTKSSSTRAEELLKTSLQSIDSFKQNAGELVFLARRISAMPSKRVIIGADSPTYMARQIADLLIGDDLLAHHGGVLTLHECFVLYNESRCIGLVTPEMFDHALNLMDDLRLPIRIRKLESGLRIVESRGHTVQIRQALKQWMNSEPDIKHKGVSAREVSEHFGFGVYIALEELRGAEKDGDLCRDEHISGLKFFPNLFRV